MDFRLDQRDVEGRFGAQFGRVYVPWDRAGRLGDGENRPSWQT
jgi:hypothetical protein